MMTFHMLCVSQRVCVFMAAFVCLNDFTMSEFLCIHTQCLEIVSVPRHRLQLLLNNKNKTLCDPLPRLPTSLPLLSDTNSGPLWAIDSALIH